jgi:copper transport protein
VTASFAQLDMEMGEQAYHLSETRPGFYQHSAPALVMVGHWGLSFEIQPSSRGAFNVLLLDRASE